jgi:4-hydroxybenzoate polyprenyltransferase
MNTATLSPPLTVRGRLRLIAGDIKIAHSVFALPFAILAAFMAAAPRGAAIDWRGFGGQLALIVAAMVCARTVAMLANRWIDREIDKHNPRTKNRPLASGQLSAGAAVVAMIACAIAFTAVCGVFGMVYGNWWPLILSLPVLTWISAYGYLKRFTALCHIYLGSSLALSPIAAAIAIQPESVAPWSSMFQPGLWLLSAMVLCWVAGFDIIYALQDVEVDRAQNLHSMPARLGVTKAMWVSRALHALAAACLFAHAVTDDRFGVLFLAGCAIVAGLLIYEHLTVSRWGASKIALAFFTLNGIISCLLGLLGVLDLIAV